MNIKPLVLVIGLGLPLAARAGEAPQAQPKVSTDVLVERRQFLIEQMQKLDAQLKLIPYYVREIDEELRTREAAEKAAQKPAEKAPPTKASKP